ncbi:ParB/RepB/Spo0J family partition protein [Maritimibacter sp. DP1N21-5]|uniref:ParB/RepB/Spo0J family partition protein n=1 Tax=Maritimibacter sp. DP1N21-5 TaxID=2836867 RepID=UPI001C48BA58|nr:ParB/RepB/Spo0J family partition protein [Maritimibacter sp. DP1N21-5]MBV7408177.1 ParB/RepB/Spo0J family partition protein [Maritimibacter sp. DP1N21-5]
MTRPITPIPFDFDNPSIAGSPGEPAVLPIAELRIDDAYQRSINAKSAKVIRTIARNFNWAKFLPVIVVRAPKGYDIVDGQHRTTAALSIGISQVPAYILDCTAREAAGAFAAINGNVTPVSPVDIWFAELAAGDLEAAAMKAMLDAAGVTITRSKDITNRGETRSIGVLRRARAAHGDALLTTVLQCIVDTGEGNVGMINGAVINGIANAIRTKPELLAEPSRLFDIFDDIDLSMMLADARIEQATTGNGPQFIITREINARLHPHLKQTA